MVLGIRPDVIRASTLIRLLRDELGKDFELIWTGQHYSRNLKDVFFDQLDVGLPDIDLQISGTTDAELVASGIVNLSRHLQKESPSAVIFLGDTNSVMSCIAAAQLNIPILHIEGCMRSFDWRMPEEKYRTVIDHLSDVIFTYTSLYQENGIREGLEKKRIHIVGNPIVEVLQEFVKREEFKRKSGESLEDRNLISRGFYLATCHRRENLESKSALVNIFRLFAEADLPVVLPLGYRTQRALEDYGIAIPKNVIVEEPIDYLNFISLCSNSAGVLTDSGTVVEEACILGVPSIQMRISTERPEVYDVNSSIKFDPIECYDYQLIYKKLKALVWASWEQPFGDGKSSERIAEIIFEMRRLNKFGTHSPDFSNIGTKIAFQ